MTRAIFGVWAIAAVAWCSACGGDDDDGSPNTGGSGGSSGESGAPSNGESGAPGNGESGAPGNGESGAPSSGEGGVPGAGGGGANNDSTCKETCPDVVAAGCDLVPDSVAACEQQCDAFLGVSACSGQWAALQACAEGKAIVCTTGTPSLPAPEGCETLQQQFVACYVANG